MLHTELSSFIYSTLLVKCVACTCTHIHTKYTHVYAYRQTCTHARTHTRKTTRTAGGGWQTQGNGSDAGLQQSPSQALQGTSAFAPSSITAQVSEWQQPSSGCPPVRARNFAHVVASAPLLLLPGSMVSAPAGFANSVTRDNCVKHSPYAHSYLLRNY